MRCLSHLPFVCGWRVSTHRLTAAPSPQGRSHTHKFPRVPACPELTQLTSQLLAACDEPSNLARTRRVLVAGEPEGDYFPDTREGCWALWIHRACQQARLEAQDQQLGSEQLRAQLEN